MLSTSSGSFCRQKHTLQKGPLYSLFDICPYFQEERTFLGSRNCKKWHFIYAKQTPLKITSKIEAEKVTCIIIMPEGNLGGGGVHKKPYLFLIKAYNGKGLKTGLKQTFVLHLLTSNSIKDLIRYWPEEKR